jgi:hypothetical protein
MKIIAMFGGSYDEEGTEVPTKRVKSMKKSIAWYIE